MSTIFDRRRFLAASVAAGTSALVRTRRARADELVNAKTNFQVACMTLPYSAFPLFRALKGIADAGYKFVAWGTEHKESGDQRTPVMPIDAEPLQAKQLGQRCRDQGLEPVMMFSTIYPEHDGAVEKLASRIRQAAAAGIGQVLTFGHTQGGDRKLWIERFKKLGPIAREHGVLLVVKQHGGSTGTGEALAAIAAEVDDPGIMINYDAGNVMDYLDLDPIPDIEKSAKWVRSFCIKDHRNWPVDQDCGPGFGEIDHYRLLRPVAFTGLTMPLCCENISAPGVPSAANAEGVDALARRAREYLEFVIPAVQNAVKP